MNKFMSFMQRVKYIFWDWNGTLLDDAELCASILNRLLSERKLPTFDLAAYREVFCFPIRQYYINAGIDLTKEDYEALGADFMNEYERRKSSALLQPYASKALSEMKERGIGQSILSAYMQETLNHSVQSYGLVHFFDHLAGHEDLYPVSKAIQGKRLLDSLGIDPGTVLMVGDTVHDFEIATELGLNCLLVSNGHNSEARLKATGANTAADLSCLLN